jgi:hypothetical protein
MLQPEQIRLTLSERRHLAWPRLTLETAASEPWWARPDRPMQRSGFQPALAQCERQAATRIVDRPTERRN